MPKAAVNKDIKKRVKKNQNKEQVEAKHDLLTALKVALRKMLEETVKLTELNIKETRREVQERTRKK